MSRRCRGINEDGDACGAPPRTGGPFCFWHDPETQTEAQEARRLGGLRRRREGAIGGAYEVEGVATPAQIQRIVEIAILNTLELPNSVMRNRTLGTLAQTAQRVLESGEFAERLAALEAAALPRALARRR